MIENHIDVSIIIPCKNEGINLISTIDSMLKSKNSLQYEIIVVDNESEDHCTDFLESSEDKRLSCNIKLVKSNAHSIGMARNIGAKNAKGRYLFFCDGHIEVHDYWLDCFINSLETSKAQIIAPCIVNMLNPTAVAYGMTWNNELGVCWQYHKPIGIAETPLVCGCTFGIKKEVFDKIYGFDKLLIGYGVEDLELCLKAWLYGYKIVIDPEVKVKHLFRSVHPYTIMPAHGIYNLLCLGYYHFKPKRLEKLIKLQEKYDVFSDVALNIQANSSQILSIREKYFSERLFNDDFFFEKFNIDF